MTKLDVKGNKVVCFVLWIKDTFVWAGKRKNVRAVSRLGTKDDYTLTYEFNNKWILNEKEINYELCISQIKEIERLEYDTLLAQGKAPKNEASGNAKSRVVTF